MISEKEGYCCWRNNNGCCAPPKEDMVCTQAFTDCCKLKTYDEETNTYEYEYGYGEGFIIPKIPKDGNHIKIIKLSLVLFILILF